MEELNVFADTGFGKAALAKLKNMHADFRLYCAGFVGEDSGTMEVSGMQFRCAKSGPRKGTLCIPIPGTKRTVYVTRTEIEAAKTA